MQITKDSPEELTIAGHIKKTESYFDLKRVLTEMIEGGAKEIKINIPDSITITSSIIGLLLRVVNEDGIRISLCVAKDQLYNLLDSLNMLKVFNVSRP